MKLMRRLLGEQVIGADPAEVQRLRARLLGENDLFQGIADEEMAAIADRLPMSTCRKGRLVYSPDTTGEALFLLKSGRVRLYRLTSDGRKLVLGVLEPGTAFGEMSMLAQSLPGSFAEAIEDCLICVMSRVDLEQIFHDHPEIAVRMVGLLAQRLREAEDRLEQMAFTPVPIRLAQLLLALQRDGQVAGFSHGDLAEMIGTSRETVSRIMVGWKVDGFLGVDRRCIQILDPDALRDAAVLDA
jgi:CRP/FNR family transcriptional regulator, cyclic AMP receptor protein